MAGDVRSLTVKWLGDASNLVSSSKKAASAVGTAGKDIAGHGNKMAGVFGQLGKVLGSFHLPFGGAAKSVTGDFSRMEAAGIGTGSAVAGGLAVAGAAAAEFARESIDAAENFNKAHERLAVVVENVGQSMKDEADAITNNDDKLVQLGFSSTDTESAMAKLVPVTHDVGKATVLLGVAADVARARNQTLDEATSTLVAVEAGRLKGLAKLGIAQKDANGKTITAAEAVQKLNAQFGGAASEYATTYAGKLAVMKAETNDLKVAIGNQLLPVLSDFAGGVALALNGVDDLSKKIHVNLGRAIEDVLSLGLAEFARKALGDVHHAGDDAAETMKRLQVATRAYADDLAKGDKTSVAAKQHQKEYTEANKAAKVINDGLATAATTATAATAAQTAGTKEAKKAAEDRAKAQKTETDAILGTRDADIGLSNSMLGVSDSIDAYLPKLAEAVKQHGKNAQANRDWERASNDVKSSIDGVASSAANAATQEAALHGKTLDAKGSADAQRTALENLRGTIQPGNPFRSYLDGLIRDLDRAATPRHANITLKVIEQTPSGQVTVDPQGVVRAAYGYAEGGYVPGPIGAPVLATVHGGEYITRAQDVGRGGPGGATVNHYTINVNVAPGANPADVGRSLVASIRAYERKNGSSWRA
jgi:hypothetical protein